MKNKHCIFNVRIYSFLYLGLKYFVVIDKLVTDMLFTATMYLLYSGMQNMLLCHQIPPCFTHIISSFLPTTNYLSQQLCKPEPQSSKLSRHGYHLVLLGGRGKDICKLFLPRKNYLKYSGMLRY